MPRTDAQRPLPAQPQPRDLTRAAPRRGDFRRTLPGLACRIAAQSQIKSSARCKPGIEHQRGFDAGGDPSGNVCKHDDLCHIANLAIAGCQNAQVHQLARRQRINDHQHQQCQAERGRGDPCPRRGGRHNQRQRRGERHQ